MINKAKLKSFFDGKSILVTGGTGTLGKAIIQLLSSECKPNRLIIYSRDEYKQNQVMGEYGGCFPHETLRFLIGDVRDKSRLAHAMLGVDYVIHAAALKQVPLCEYNPWEAVQTNVVGTKNVVDAAISSGVKRVVLVSSDKAVDPINVYGITKQMAERVMINGNIVASRHDPRPKFSVVRYGNVIASRGSVFEVFDQQIQARGQVWVTRLDCTRFWWTIEQARNFVIYSLMRMEGGEIFLPHLKATSMQKIVEGLPKNVQIREYGHLRHGEKLHEVLVSQHDEKDRVYFIAEGGFRPHVIQPILMQRDYPESWRVPHFGYCSLDQDRQLNEGELEYLFGQFWKKWEGKK